MLPTLEKYENKQIQFTAKISWKSVSFSLSIKPQEEHRPLNSSWLKDPKFTEFGKTFIKDFLN